MSSFKLVHFVADPFSGARVPIGAIVETGGTRLWVEAKHVPGPACLGNAKSAAALSLVRARLLSMQPSFEVLPVSVAPHAQLDVERRIPDNVRDPRAWVENTFFPAPSEGGRVEESDRPARVHRATRGLHFLKLGGVAKYVGRSFRPRDRWSDELGAMAESLKPVSLFVEGVDEVLLLEPIAPAAPKDVEAEVSHVSSVFGSYQFCLRKRSPELASRAKFLAYFLPGVESSVRSRAADALRDYATHVTDGERVADRQRLFDTVRRVGQSFQPQL